jgi:hypothetical protein
LKLKGKTIRPFSLTAQVKCRAYSHHLQKAIVDFGADTSFREAQKKLREHYRIEINISAIQAIVENHAKRVFEYIEKDPVADGSAQLIIAEMDGSMVPVVDTGVDENLNDKRLSKKVRWQEARLCFARQPMQLKSIFYATMGSVDKAGDLLYRAAKRAGLGPHTRVHGIGDGAKWIEIQMRMKFQSRVNYLIDFYHISEYLSEAANHSWTSEKEKWLKEKQALLKENKHKEVLKSIRIRLPIDWDPNQEEEGTPVEKCYKYILNRENCLDYKGALERDLPIGSGEIESGHRHIIQKRLKIAGAWWKPSTANHMLALRTLRANEDWDSYWQ